MTDRITSASLLELVRRLRDEQIDTGEPHDHMLMLDAARAIESLTGEGDLGGPRASALEEDDEIEAIKARHAEEWKHSTCDSARYNWVSEPFAAQAKANTEITRLLLIKPFIVSAPPCAGLTPAVFPLAYVM